MRLLFTKKKNRDDGIPDDSQIDDFPGVDDDGGREKKKGSPIVRIALYVGLSIVIAVSVAGYLYVKSAAGHLNKRLSGNRQATDVPIDINSLTQEPSSAEKKSNTDGPSPWAGAPGGPSREPSPSQKSSISPPAQIKPDSHSTQSAFLSPGAVLSSPAPRASNEAGPSVPGKQNVHAASQLTMSTKTGSAPVSAGKSGKKTSPPATQAALSDRPEAPLDQLVLKDDNPFRDKFLKKFQDSQVSKSLKDGKAFGKLTQIARSGKPGSTSKAVMSFGEGELSILPGIAGVKDPSENVLKVYGIIRTQNNSIALTNRGELKEGSMVDGDSVASVTMNEVCLKSGRTLKVSAQ